MVDSAVVKIRMKTGNVSKKEKTDQRAENNTSQPKGLQHSEIIQHPSSMFE